MFSLTFGFIYEGTVRIKLPRSALLSFLSNSGAQYPDNKDTLYTFKSGAVLCSDGERYFIQSTRIGNYDIYNAIAEMQLWQLYYNVQKSHDLMRESLERRGRILYPKINLVKE